MEQNAEDYKNIMNSLLDVTSLERNSLTNLVKLYDVFNLFTSIRGRKNLENLQDLKSLFSAFGDINMQSEEDENE